MSASVNDVTAVFADDVVLDDVSFSVATGERFAIMGPSGAGKSTLLRVIAGLERPRSGSVTIDGVIVDGLPPHRRPVGLMFQDFALFPHLSVRANVAYGPRMQGADKQEQRRIADELLATVGLTGFGERSPASLSGGERQRVALARTLAPRPSLILLDEPLGSVDRILRDDLLTEMRSILESLATTSIYVTHDRFEAETFADRVAILRAGRIVRIGTPAEVWDDPHTAFVARFVGHRSVLEGAAIGADPGLILIHPWAITVSATGTISAVVRSSGFRDGRYRSDVALGDDIIEIETDDLLETGDAVSLDIDPEGIRRLLVDEV